MLLETETNDGVDGWLTGSYTHGVTIVLIDRFLAPRHIGEAPFRTDRINDKQRR